MLVALSLVLGFLSAAYAQEPLITTVAGTDFVFPRRPAPALQAPLSSPRPGCFDALGNFYFGDGNYILRLSPTGMIERYAGTGVDNHAGDGGPALRAALWNVAGLACDGQQNMYVIDLASFRKIDASGTISTIGYLAPMGVAVDTKSRIYAFDLNQVYTLEPSETLRPFAGNGDSGTSGDGRPALQATFTYIQNVAADSRGNVYILDGLVDDFGGSRVRRVRSDGIIEAFAGGGVPFRYPKDGADARQVWLGLASGLAIDAQDNVLIASGADLVRVSPSFQLNVLGHSAFEPEIVSSSGSLLEADFSFGRCGLAVSPAGYIYLLETDSGLIRRADATGRYEMVAGTGARHFGGDGGPANLATLDSPSGVAVDSKGNIYISDWGNHRIRKINPSGVITTVAGNGVVDWPLPETPALSSPLLYPGWLSLDPNEWLVVAQDGILRLDSTGTWQLLASGMADYPVVGRDGSVYAVGVPPTSVLKAAPGQRLATFAGTRVAGFEGDGGPASQARFHEIDALALDASGSLLVGDWGNSRIRRISQDGTVSTVARVTFPYRWTSLYHGLAVDAAGRFYFGTDSAIFRVNANGQQELVAGTPEEIGFGGDGGPAAGALLRSVEQIAFDPAGNLYIADTQNNRVRKLLASPPEISVDVQSVRLSASSTGALTDPVRIALRAAIPGVAFQANPDPASKWLSVQPGAGNTPRTIEVQADPADLAPGEYTGRVIITAPDANPPQISVPVQFNVEAARPPAPAVDNDLLTFTYSKLGRPTPQTLMLRNAGGGAAVLAISASSRRREAWLRVSPNVASVTARTPIPIQVLADPTGMPVGTWTGQVVITAENGASVAATVVMTISDHDRIYRLSQSGLSFLSVAGGGVVPPQNFAVLSLGTSSVPFSTGVRTSSGGDHWLKAAPRSNTVVTSGASPFVDVTIDQTGLLPGRYSGLVRVDAPGAANTPQVVAVYLDVLPSDARPPVVVQPSELLFGSGDRDTAASAQDVTIYNLGAEPVLFRAVASDGLDVLPRDGLLDPREPYVVTVQPTLPFPSGAIGFQFSDGSVQEVSIRRVRDTGKKAAKYSTFRTPPLVVGSCAPRSLSIAVRFVGQPGYTPAGWPVGMGVDVHDDCGLPVAAGTVSATFSNGDRAVELVSVENGLWHGTWTTSNKTKQVTIHIHAESPNSLQGDHEYSTSLSSRDIPPSLSVAGIVTYASPSPNSPLAPGTLITLNGDNLTSGGSFSSAAGGPLPYDFDSMSITFGDDPVPLVSASPRRVDALVPFTIEPNVPHQLLVTKGIYYANLDINVAEASPVILTEQDSQQAIAMVLLDSGPVRNGAADPAHPSDTIQIVCIGLGKVDQTIDPSAPSPAAPPAGMRNAVVVRVGGRDLTPQSAGLTPGLFGVYQVKVTLPDDVPVGSAVLVTVEVAGQVSNVASLNIAPAK